MHMTRFAFILALVACGSSGGSTTPQVDAASGPLCTGVVYDPCMTNDQCNSGNCRMYNGAGLQVCTQVCSTMAPMVPCPNDSSGAVVTCNTMLNCKPTVANNCHR